MAERITDTGAVSSVFVGSVGERHKGVGRCAVGDTVLAEQILPGSAHSFTAV